jgi:two-component system nitrate/nitrite sensor histidine kinase NarX
MIRLSPRIRKLRHSPGTIFPQSQQHLENAELKLSMAMQRLETILQISLRMAEACEETEVARMVLPLAVELAGAKGGAFVPLDEHGQSKPLADFGELPFADLNAWLEYMASSQVRARCRSCGTRNITSATLLNGNQACPLLITPFGEVVKSIYCFPIRRNGHEYGLISLYMPTPMRSDSESMIFFQALIDQTGFAMEAIRTRRRELAAMQYIQTWRQKTDLDALLVGILDDVILGLEADFAEIILIDDGTGIHRLVRGNFIDHLLPEVDRLFDVIITSREAHLFNETGTDPRLMEPIVYSLLAAPILTSDRIAIGGLLVGNLHQQDVGSRSLSLLQTLAGQVGLILQHAKSQAELEYKTIIQERTRLSREIHDGLAQTLAFLKLQTAQMQKYLAQQNHAKLRQSLSVSYTTLSEAYEEARRMIDELRIELNGKGLAGWLEQVLIEFKETSGANIEIELIQISYELSPEVHAQLIRIVQEALNNIRIHTHADHVWIKCYEEEGLVLEIRDNGSGFIAEEVPISARHGLQGMHERAELIGADLQVLSQPNKGTTVRVKLAHEYLKGERIAE